MLHKIVIGKIKNKIRKFFNPLLNLKNPEAGIGVTGTILLVAGLLALFTGGVVGGAKIFGPGIMGDMFASIASAIPYALMSICLGFTIVAAKIFESVVSSSFIAQTITKDAVFLMGWDIVRNFANMFVVLGFVVIGLATILRIQEYQAQKKLLPLIIVALLINFSPMLCGLVIDATNITIDYFLKNGGAGSMATRMVNDMQQGVEESLKIHLKGGADTVGTYIVACIGSTIIYATTGIVFLLLGLLFVIRKVLLLCLVILSPLAFVSYPFKAAKSKIFDKWLQEFLEWCLAGVTASFFIYLAAQTMLGKGVIGNDPSSINQFLVPMVFLFIAYKLAKGTKAMGAAAVIGLATVGAGIAAKGAGKIAGKTAKFATDKTGLSRAGAAIKDKTSALGERMGILKPGTTTAGQRTRLDSKERTSRLESMDSAALARVVEGRGIGQENRLDRAKGMEILAKRNSLDTIDPGHRQAATDNAMTHGVHAETLGKADYHYAAFDNSKVARIRQASPGLSLPQAQQAAVQQTLDENITNMSHDQLRNVDATDLTRERVNRLTPDKIRAYQYASQDRRNAISSQAQQLAQEAINANDNAQRAIAQGNQAQATHHTTEFNRLSGIIRAIQNLP